MVGWDKGFEECVGLERGGEWGDVETDRVKEGRMVCIEGGGALKIEVSGFEFREGSCRVLKGLGRGKIE